MEWLEEQAALVVAAGVAVMIIGTATAWRWVTRPRTPVWVVEDREGPIVLESEEAMAD